MTTSEAIAKRILELCKAVRQSTVNDIVNGRTNNAGILTIKKLCDGLDITLADFFGAPVFRTLEQEIR